MKKFVVNSEVPYSHEKSNLVAWVMDTPKMLKDAGVKDVKFKTCYCCTPERQVVCEFEAPDKEALTKSLGKISFPIKTVLETEKLTPEK